MVHITISLQKTPPSQSTSEQLSTIGDKHDVAQSQKHPMRLLTISAAALVLLSGGAWVLHDQEKFASPIPNPISENLSFSIYYPGKLPATYSYKSGSATISNGVLFYGLRTKDGQTVTISEQPKPSDELALSSLVGYSPFQTAIGKGVIGSQNSAPSALLETPQTLLTISGTQDVPSNIVSEIAKNLKVVH